MKKFSKLKAQIISDGCNGREKLFVEFMEQFEFDL